MWIMNTKINCILRQAITTFTCKSDMFYMNLQILKSLLDKSTAEDVNLHPQFMNEQFWTQPGKAPVACIEIYEDKHVTMGIFILKSGGRLPLHNHPEMYGLIKVIAGKIKVVSYSINTEKTKEIDQKAFEDSLIPLPRLRKKIVTAELNSAVIVDTESPASILEPNIKNLHEIQSIDGPAAFLDILSPPYETQIDGNGIRHCAYYTRLSQIMPNVFRLQEIRSPSWYWTDSYPYTGPPLFTETASESS